MYKTFTCIKCGEYRVMALLADSDLCRNCNDKEHAPRIRRCPICNQRNVSGQSHHIAGKANNKYLTIQICISCHSILTYWQRRWPNRNAVISLYQGIYDLGKLTATSYKLSGNTPMECLEDMHYIAGIYKTIILKSISFSLFNFGLRR